MCNDAMNGCQKCRTKDKCDSCFPDDELKKEGDNKCICQGGSGQAKGSNAIYYPGAIKCYCKDGFSKQDDDTCA